MLWEAHVADLGGAMRWTFNVPESGLQRRIFGDTGAFVLKDTSGPNAKNLFSGNVPERAEMDLRLNTALRDKLPGYDQEFHIITPARTFLLHERVSITPIGKGEWNIVGLVVDITERREAEEARRASELQIEEILNSVDCVLWQARVKELPSGDFEWYFLRMPPTKLFRRIFGSDPPENMHHLWTEREVPDLQLMDQRATGALRSGAPGYEQEFKVSRDGRHLWVREQVSITPMDRGRWRIVGIITDVTARKEAEEARRESQTQLEELLNKADCVLWQAVVNRQAGSENTDWRFYRIPPSRLYRRIFGHDPLENRDKLWSPAESPDAEHMDRTSVEALVSGAPGYEQEFRIIEGGRTYWLHERVSITAIQPDQWQVVGVTLDISGRRIVEAALSAEKERLAVTLSAMDEGVITIDLFGTVQFMNPVAERLTACLPGAGVGRAMQDVFFLGDVVPGHKRVAWPIERVLGEGRTIDLPPQAVLYSGAGRICLIEGCCAPVRNDRGDTMGAVLVFRDVTERQRLEGELQRASKLESIGVLAGGIAHDFNNLLTAIMGNLTLAAVDAQEKLPIQEYLEGAQAAALRARDLTQQLLTFAKGGDPVRSAVHLPAVVEEVAQFAVRGSRVKCEFALAADLWPADADKGQVGQIVQNLVINATQAMAEGGVIRIAANNEVIAPGTTLSPGPGNYVHISVSDSGVGIQPEHLAKIFEPYFTTKKQGSGLGLATVYSIIKKHRGHISVDSSEGSGTTFQIWLPALPGHERNGDRTENAPAAALSGRVLVMDDEEAIRTAASRMLERFGVTSDTASDGAEAVEKFRAAHAAGTPYAAIVMDLTIPGGMGGVEALAEMCKTDPAVKAIVSSGYSSNAVMGNYRTYGFKGVLAKPYGLEDFGRVLREVLGSKG
jgi:PAS domain S-box-containing protein